MELESFALAKERLLWNPKPLADCREAERMRAL